MADKGITLRDLATLGGLEERRAARLERDEERKERDALKAEMEALKQKEKAREDAEKDEDRQLKRWEAEYQAMDRHMKQMVDQDRKEAWERHKAAVGARGVKPREALKREAGLTDAKLFIQDKQGQQPQAVIKAAMDAKEKWIGEPEIELWVRLALTNPQAAQAYEQRILAGQGEVAGAEYSPMSPEQQIKVEAWRQITPEMYVDYRRQEAGTPARQAEAKASALKKLVVGEGEPVGRQGDKVVLAAPEAYAGTIQADGRTYAIPQYTKDKAETERRRAFFWEQLDPERFRPIPKGEQAGVKAALEKQAEATAEKVEAPQAPWERIAEPQLKALQHLRDLTPEHPDWWKLNGREAWQTLQGFLMAGHEHDTVQQALEATAVAHGHDVAKVRAAAREAGYDLEGMGQHAERKLRSYGAGLPELPIR